MCCHCRLQRRIAGALTANAHDHSESELCAAKGKHNKAHGAVSEDSGVPVEGLPPQVAHACQMAELEDLLPMHAHIMPSIVMALTSFLCMLSLALSSCFESIRQSDHLVQVQRADTNQQPEWRGVLQILFSFPSERAPPAEVANMCFPHGVHPHVLQRTPSMTALNQFFCGQQYSHADTHSFIFFSKVSHVI